MNVVEDPAKDTDVLFQFVNKQSRLAAKQEVLSKYCALRTAIDSVFLMTNTLHLALQAVPGLLRSRINFL